VTARRADFIALGLVVLGLLLRLVRVDDGLWYDEMVTLVEFVRRPLGDIITIYTNQNQHVLYSLLARISIGILGESDAALRLPAVLLGAGSIWALYRLGRQVASVPEALLSAALLTLSFHHLWFSQNARGYTGLMVFSIVGTGALLRLLRDGQAGWRWVAGYAVVMGLSAYTHMTSVLISAGQAIVVAAVWLDSRRRGSPGPNRAILALLLSGAVALVLYAPLIPQLLAMPFSADSTAVATEWVNPSYFVIEAVRGLAAGLPGGWLGLAAGAVVILVGCRSYWRQDPAILGLLVLPGVVTVAVALLLGHTLRPRFVFFSLGFGALIAVRGTFALAEMAFRHRGRALATAALALGALGAALKIPAAWGPKQDFVGAAAFVDRSAGGEDAIATVDLTALPYLRYFERPWVELTGPEQLGELERRHRRTWVLTTFPISLGAAQPEVAARLRQDYDTAGVFPGTVAAGEIVVLVSRPPKSSEPAPDQAAARDR
jgi:hypothetical protein